MRRLIRTNRLVWVMLLIVAAAILVTPLIGSGYSRYKTEVVVTGELSYSNQLCEGFRLLEHTSKTEADGSYTPEEETVTQASYLLIPGTTIPADPYISIRGKTEIPCVLYVELEIPEGVELEIRKDWVSTGLQGPKGGDVYAYSPDTLLAAGDHEISVLTEDGIRVNPRPLTEGTEFNVVGYLVQADEQYSPSADSARDLFESRLQTAPQQR